MALAEIRSKVAAKPMPSRSDGLPSGSARATRLNCRSIAAPSGGHGGVQRDSPKALRRNVAPTGIPPSEIVWMSGSIPTMIQWIGSPGSSGVTTRRGSGSPSGVSTALLLMSLATMTTSAVPCGGVDHVSSGDTPGPSHPYRASMTPPSIQGAYSSMTSAAGMVSRSASTS